MDSQREAVYHAEHRLRRWLDQTGPVTVFGSRWDLEPDIRFVGIPDVQRYVDKVLGHLGRDDKVGVRARRGMRKAHYCDGVISIPPRSIGGEWALREIVVLHEIAHHLAGVHGHGPLFTRAFLDLLDATGKPMTARVLQAAFWEAGVQIAPHTANV